MDLVGGRQLDRKDYLLHAWGFERQVIVLQGDGDQHEAGLLAGSDHVSVFLHHHPKPAERQTGTLRTSSSLLKDFLWLSLTSKPSTHPPGGLTEDRKHLDGSVDLKVAVPKWSAY